MCGILHREVCIRNIPTPCAHRQVIVGSEEGTAQNRNIFSHISLGVRDLDRTQTFYDAALAPLGSVRLWRTARGVGYGPPNPNGDEKLALFLKAETDVPLAAGPGFHLALIALSTEAVDAFHAAAMANGGRDDGRPGLRPQCGKAYELTLGLSEPPQLMISLTMRPPKSVRRKSRPS
jgi:catechol 2,3-dioxygenase-like lactoylglutathione lyase family enzyme